MDPYAQEVRARMPLAEATLLIWRHIADPEHLESVFDRHRGRSYTQVLSFPHMVQLLSDALLQHAGSGRRAFESAKEAGELNASIQAAYGKLRRIPVEVSMAFLFECTDRLRELHPTSAPMPLPKSLRKFPVIALDGKTIKWVAKRLKVLRKVRGGAIGGKALVGLSLNTGLVLGMHAHPDGDANEVRFVPDLLPELRQRVEGPRLFLADRAFCDLVQLNRFCVAGDHFLVRYHARLSFQLDTSRKAIRGQDADGRPYEETWGWLGKPHDPRRVYVRRITLQRLDEDPLIIVTDLLEPAAFPATDLLELYRQRWGIERVFQQITEVFGLQTLIGTSPQATIFQLAFCLLIYNITMIAKAYIAAAQQRSPETISTEKLFDDVEKHLIAWNLFFTPQETSDYLTPFRTVKKIHSRLNTLLRLIWTDVWLKSPSQKRHKPPRRVRGESSHVSVYRLLSKVNHPKYNNSKRNRNRGP